MNGEEARAAGVDRERMLLEFIRDSDVDCPACGYNLRNLTRPVCPECSMSLELKVGVQNLRIGGLLLTAAPGLGYGVLAVFLLALMIIHPGAPLEVVVLDVLGFISGFAAVALLWFRRRFMLLPTGFQYGIAAAIWAVHIAGFGWAVMVFM